MDEGAAGAQPLAEQFKAHRAHLRAVAHRRPGSTHPACCRWESVPTQGSACDTQVEPLRTALHRGVQCPTGATLILRNGSPPH
jgi:hypothetical protein